MFHLALKLGKTVGEIRQMPASEFLEWAAYLNLQAKGKGAQQTPEEMMAVARTRGYSG